MLYKAILKAAWTYGIQLWGTASNSNIETLQRFQWKTLRSLIDVPWYVTNETIHRELKIPTIKEEISKFSNRYNIRVNNHQNPLVTQLIDTSDPHAKKTLPCNMYEHLQIFTSFYTWTPFLFFLFERILQSILIENYK